MAKTKTRHKCVDTILCTMFASAKGTLHIVGKKNLVKKVFNEIERRVRSGSVWVARPDINEAINEANVSPRTICSHLDELIREWIRISTLNRNLEWRFVRYNNRKLQILFLVDETDYMCPTQEHPLFSDYEHRFHAIAKNIFNVDLWIIFAHAHRENAAWLLIEEAT